MAPAGTTRATGGSGVDRHPSPHASSAASTGPRREALAMGLYTAITLMAGLTVTSDDSGHRATLLVVWGTTVGLAVTHWFTFVLAARLADPGSDESLGEEVVAQIGAAVAVAVPATVAVVLLPDDLERSGARLTAAALIVLVTLAQLRSFGSSWARSLRGAAVALVLSSAVVALNHAVGH